MRKSNLRQLLASSAAAGALSLAVGAHAQAEQVTFTFDQPSMPMAAALQNVGRETGVNILVDASLVKDLKSPELKGQLSSDAALMALLDGTGLSVRKTAANSVMIVSAQDPQGGSAAGGGATVEALIVTAQKREEDIQDVPIAISAFSQEDLTRAQIAGGPDLMTQVPNMTFTKTNFSSYSIQLRGIGTQAISATVDPAVAVAFNNTPFVRNRFFEQEFYDLQRVEVLRGPQGTLYGRNATAGVVNIISAKPKFNVEAKLSADVANYNTTRVEGMINIPLIEDAVALRIAGAWTKRDGYAFNEITGTPIDGRDLWSTRVSLRFSPTDSFDANLIWEHFEEDDDRLRSGKQLCHTDFRDKVGPYDITPSTILPDNGQGGNGFTVQSWLNQGCKAGSLYAPEAFQTPNGRSLAYYSPLRLIGLPAGLDEPYVNQTQSRDLRVIESQVDPHYSAENDIIELQASLDLTDTLSLTSETAWSSDFVFSTQDLNRFNTKTGAFLQPNPSGGGWADRVQGLVLPGPNGGVYCDPQIGCSDRLVAVDLSTAKSTTFSQEFRLASDFDGPFNFSLGGNFLRYDTHEKYYVFINTLGLISGYTQFGGAELPPYVPNESDNKFCLPDGPIPPDPSVPQPVLFCTYRDPNPIGSLNDQGHNYFLSINPYKLISYAVFGEAYYQLADNLKVTAGLRWTVDKKEAPRIPSWVLASESLGYPVMEVLEQEWREPTGRLTIDWKPNLAFTDETLLYASYAHGYKAGGANPPPYGIALAYVDTLTQRQLLDETATHPKAFDPEFVDAFELGAKNTLLDGRLTLNTAAFYYDYK
ncbi:MAG TPA: TonB-dependent receptor, partial [Caulobacteraceae bacterium]